MNPSTNGQWEILLADLALILFIVALGGLVSMPLAEGAHAGSKGANDTSDITPNFAPSQALYRQVDGGPSLAEWLISQPRDPRATLTIFVDYRSDDAARELAVAAQMIAEAQSTGVTVRTVMRAAEDKDIYASLAFDTPS